MDVAHIQIQRLTPADAALYRDIRLEGLRCSPEAFGSFEIGYAASVAVVMTLVILAITGLQLFASRAWVRY